MSKALITDCHASYLMPHAWFRIRAGPMAAKKNIVHVVGTGTIGEPLVGLFTQFGEKWGIDELTFHKRTPSADDRAMVNALINRGARLVADEGARDDFARLGHR